MQIPMVSKATGIAPVRPCGRSSHETHGAELGFLGSSYIVVLQLNEALAIAAPDVARTGDTVAISWRVRLEFLRTPSGPLGTTTGAGTRMLDGQVQT